MGVTLLLYLLLAHVSPFSIFDVTRQYSIRFPTDFVGFGVGAFGGANREYTAPSARVDGGSNFGARGDGRRGEAREDLRAGMGGIRRPRAGDAGGLRGPRQGVRAANHLLAQGLHPPHEALPRQLRLLHLRPRPPTRRERLPDAGGGARGRTRGCC